MSTRVSACIENAHHSEQCRQLGHFREAPASFPYLLFSPMLERQRSSPTKLVDESMVNIAPTNLIIYVLSVSVLFETVACYGRVCAGKQI